MAILVPTLVGANSARYAAIASFVVFSYDHCLTLGDEVCTSAAVWSTNLKWAWAGPIFLVRRVDDIASAVLSGECNWQVHCGRILTFSYRTDTFPTQL